MTLPGPDVPVIDETRLINEFGGDQEILDELRDLFLEHAPPLFAAINQAIASGDTESLARDAHSFKGACARQWCSHPAAASCGRWTTSSAASCSRHARIASAQRQHRQAS